MNGDIPDILSPSPYPLQVEAKLNHPPGMQREQAPSASCPQAPRASVDAVPLGAYPLIGFFDWDEATVLLGWLEMYRDRPFSLLVLCILCLQILCLSSLGMSCLLSRLPLQNCPPRSYSFGKQPPETRGLPLTTRVFLCPHLHPK